MNSFQLAKLSMQKAPIVEDTIMRNYLICGIVLLFAWPAKAQLVAPNDTGVTFSHMHVVVADVNLHKKLWTELFDAVLIEREGYTAVSVPGALVFFREGDPTMSSEMTVVDHFGFDVKDLSTVISKWTALGYALDSEVIDNYNTRTAFITFPGGIKLSLHENSEQSESTKMGHVHFATPVRAELVTWYARLFGATSLTTTTDASVFEVPGSSLSFIDAENVRYPTEGAAIDHIGFEIEDWNDFVESIESEGIEFEFGPMYIESLELWVAFFNDPNGALVEISHGLDKF